MDTADSPTQLGIRNSSARVLPKGTVAFCRTASVGKVAILGRDMATSQDFVNWVCGPDLDPRYLYHALRSSQPEFERQKQGSTHKTIYFPVVQQFKVLLPPLPEQRRIAAILDKADSIRRKRQQALELTEEFLRSVFLDMFGDPVTNPKGWEVKELGDLASAVQYGTSVKCDDNPKTGGLPVLRIPNVLGGRTVWENLKYQTVLPAERDKLLLKRGDLLFVRTNGNPDYIGRCAVYDDDRPAIFASYLIRIQLDEDELVLPEFLQAVVSQQSFRSRLTRETRTTAGNYNISGSGLRKLRVPRPPLRLQEHYVDVLSSVAQARTRNEHAAQECATLFASLVQLAFRGELSESPVQPSTAR